MTENTTAPKQTIVNKLGNLYRKHERKILITTTVASTGTALVMGTGIAKHNEFLRQHDLFNEFYDIQPTKS